MTLEKPRFSDGQLVLIVGSALFALCGWPILLTPVPPYQDLPNHLAAVAVMENPGLYPEFVFNGFFKTNAALFAWLHLFAKVGGLYLGAKIFSLFVVYLGDNAYTTIAGDKSMYEIAAKLEAKCQ